MKRKILGISVVLLAMASAWAASQSVRERTFRPLVRLAAGSGPEAPKLAATRLKDGAATLGTVLNGLDADEPTRAFFSKVLEQLEAFDLEALYESLPESLPDGVKAVGFTGHSEGAKYAIKQVVVAETEKTDPAQGLGSKFGDVALGFRSRKAGEKSDNFVGSVRTSLGLGNASWFQVVQFVAENLRLVESTGPGVAPAGPHPSKATRDEVKRDNPRLGSEDLELVGLFRESFPHVYDHLRELYRTDDVLCYDPDAENYQQIHLVMGVRRESDKHKAVIEWLDGLGPLMSGRAELCDSRGRALMTLRFSTKDLALTIDAFVASGKLCPVEGGKVLVDEGVDLETVKACDRRDRWSFEADVNGIVTEVKDLVFKVHYESTPTGLRSRIVCDEEPKIRVHGSAFGVIPTWAIDVVLPGNMQELTQSFFHVVTRGNGGKGIVVVARTRSGSNGANVLDLDMEAEGLNNFLVRLGFKLARKKLIPPDDALADLAAYLRGGHAALTKDFEGFAAEAK